MSQRAPARHAPLVIAVTCAVGLVAEPAAAYVDPAAGSMMLQLALAGVAGLAVAVRLFWRRLLALRRRRRTGEPAAEARSGDESGV